MPINNIKTNGFVAWVGIVPLVVCAAGNEPSILYAEPIPDDEVLNLDDRAESRLTFDAHGRRFEIELADNPRIGRLRRNSNSDVFTGSLHNEPGSWVRLVRNEDELSGVIRSGSDTWIIDPVSTIRAQLSSSPPASINAIYRLADTLLPANYLSCGTTASFGAPQSGAAALQAVVGELNESPVVLRAQGATERVTLSAIGDVELFNDFGRDVQATEDGILARLNIVDGIFSEEIGLEIAVDRITVFDAEPDPFSPTTNANDLLDDVFDYRQANDLGFGLTHLITGRQFSGTTAGVAYLGGPGTGVCTNSGAALSESSTPFSTALLIAHEIGHNLGARHDGEAGSPCEAEPETFIMSPTLNGNDEFSDCSKQSMATVINAASCINDIPDIDLAVSSPAEVDVPVAGQFALEFTLWNVGSTATASIAIQLTLPPEVSLDNLTIGGGTCSLVNLSCSLSTLGGNATSTVTATLRATMPGTFTASLSGQTSGDLDASNDSTSTMVFAADRLDLAANIAGPTIATASESLQATITVLNNSSVTATDVDVAIALTGNATLDSVSSQTASCSSDNCTLTTLSPQQTLDVVVALTVGSGGGTATLNADASANEPDSFQSNNLGSLTVTVSPPPSAPASGGGGGGGGGSLGAISLLALSLALRRRRPGGMMIVDHERV